MAQAIEEERRDLKVRDAARLGEYDAAITEMIEDQAKVAHFRMKASLRLEPMRVAAVAVGYRERRARQRRRDRVRTLQHIAVTAGYLPPATLGP
eukprot:13040156-Alexandrium_andersonii.AAC.1